MLRAYRRRDEQGRLAEVARLRQMALTDNLTSIRNHRAFHEDLRRELLRRERTGDSLSLVMLDMDDLKGINDRLGHQEGDEQLRALAASLMETVRGSDSAYRVGGDEFALILPETSAFAAFRVVQRLQARLSGGTRADRPSASAGIAETSGPLTNDELIRRADLALYDAKRSKRSVVVYGGDLEEPARQPEAERGERHVQILATTLARAVDAKDSATRSHCETVSQLCGLVAEELQLDRDRVARLRLAGLLHDGSSSPTREEAWEPSSGGACAGAVQSRSPIDGVTQAPPSQAGT